MNLNDVDALIEKFGGLTEEYKFYNDEITLRYDPKEHVYLLVTPTGLVRQDGVTTICHIIDKSNVLLPWACKMMAQKILATIPSIDGSVVLSYDSFIERVNSAKSAHKEKLEDAGQVGHTAHAWIEQYIKAVLAANQGRVEELLAKLPDEERAKSSCIAALDWMSKHNVRWLGTERKIYSRNHHYAGTMDGLALVDSCDDLNCCPHAFKDSLTIVDWKTSNYLYIEYVLQTGAYKQAYEEETGEDVQDIWVIRLGKDGAEFEAWHIESDLQELGWYAFFSALTLSRDMAAVEAAVSEIKDERKAKKRAEAQAAKAEALKIKCKSANKYKGVRYPTCNGGTPCETCLEKYKQRQVIPESVRDAAEDLAANVVKSLQKLLDKSSQV